MIVGPALAQDEGSVIATVDRNRVAVGDVVNFRVSISSPDSSQVSEPIFPRVDGIEVINTSSGMETRSTFQNGQFLTQSSRHFNFMLVVNKPGSITIPPIQVQAGSSTQSTQPIALEVVASGQARPRAPPPAPDPFGQMDEMEEVFNQMMQRHFGQGMPQVDPDVQVNPKEAFMIIAEADKKSAYVGEQITANFYLYTRGHIRDIDTLKYPTLKGFWKEDLEMATRLNFEQIVLNGVPYQRALLVSYALFPIKAGRSVVDSYKAKCTVLTPSSFGFGRPYQFTKVSKPIAIDVLDVPVEGRPANFTGAVGEFRVSAKFEPVTGVVNQPITLRVRFEGRGNAKLIELPKLDLPPSFELYDQKSSAEFLKDGTSFKEFEVLMIPRQPGVFDVSPLAVSVFDPARKKFNVISSQPLQVGVTGTAATAAPQAGIGDGARQSHSDGPMLPSLATGPGGGGFERTNSLWITLMLLFLTLAGLVVEGYRRLRRTTLKVNLKQVLNKRMVRVKEHANAGEWRKVGIELTNAAHRILGRVALDGGASVDIERLLEAAPPSMRNELGSAIRELLGRCDQLSFAPEEMVGDFKRPEELKRLIVQFEKVMSRAIEMSEG